MSIDLETHSQASLFYNCLPKSLLTSVLVCFLCKKRIGFVYACLEFQRGLKCNSLSKAKTSLFLPLRTFSFLYLSYLQLFHFLQDLPYLAWISVFFLQFLDLFPLSVFLLAKQHVILKKPHWPQWHQSFYFYSLPEFLYVWYLKEILLLRFKGFRGLLNIIPQLFQPPPLLRMDLLAILNFYLRLITNLLLFRCKFLDMPL